MADDRGTVLVSGAAGGLGRRLIPLLRERGWRVRTLVHHREVPEADESRPGDLGDGASLAQAAQGAAAVVHLAALTHARRVRDYQRVNVEGTANLLAAVREASAGRFLFVSTRAVSPDGGGYSRSKARAEELVKETGGDFVIVRLPEVYGAGGAEGVDEIVARARRGAAIRLVGSGSDQLCPVHVDDALEALAAALDSPAAAGRTYTLAGQCFSAREVAEICVRSFGSDSRIVGVPVPAVAAASLLARVLPVGLYPDQLDRLRAEKPPLSPEAGPDLGFAPRPLAEGLAALGGG
ncbi:MAG: NAD-dependent epimerase/dehydratase family protein [Actinomycetota bacterium]